MMCAVIYFINKTKQKEKQQHKLPKGVLPKTKKHKIYILLTKINVLTNQQLSAINELMHYNILQQIMNNQQIYIQLAKIYLNIIIKIIIIIE